MLWSRLCLCLDPISSEKERPIPDVTTGGVRIHYELEGNRNAPTLVIQHGFLGSPADWRTAGYLDALTDRYQLILIHARGYGRSDKPHDASRYTYEQMAHDWERHHPELRGHRPSHDAAT